MKFYMKRRYLYFLLLLFCLHNISYTQVHSGYIVKAIDKLFIIDCGRDDGIENGSNFMVYNHLKGKGKTRNKSDLEFFGIAEVTQTFDKLLVLKFKSLNENSKPKERNYISLIPLKEENPVNISNIAMKAEEERDTVQPLKSSKNIEIKDNFTGRKGLNYSVSIGFVGGLENFPKAISDKIENFLISEIYPFGSSINKSLPIKGGAIFTVERIITRFSSVRLSYGNLKYNRYLTSAIPDILDPSITLPEQYVKDWRFKIRTIINILSFDLLFGNFGKIKDSGEAYSKNRGIVFYGGFGGDYASFNYSTNETIKLHRYERDDVIHDETKHSLSGYWGYHALMGISYFLPALRIYAEGGYTFWNEEMLKNSNPFRIGLSFHF